MLNQCFPFGFSAMDTGFMFVCLFVCSLFAGLIIFPVKQWQRAGLRRALLTRQKKPQNNRELKQRGRYACQFAWLERKKSNLSSNFSRAGYRNIPNEKMYVNTNLVPRAFPNFKGKSPGNEVALTLSQEGGTPIYSLKELTCYPRCYKKLHNRLLPWRRTHR